MTIRAALDQLIIIQAAVAITDPVTTNIKKAWKTIPPVTADLGETPAMFNIWTLNEWQKAIQLGIERWSITSTIAVYDADLDRAADIVLALVEQYMSDLVSKSSLVNTVTGWDLRGDDPTLVSLQRSNRDYVGASLRMDIEIKQARGWS